MYFKAKSHLGASIYIRPYKMKDKSSPIRVAILTEGGDNIGFGHVTRCLSLYQAFETQGYQLDFIVNGDASVKSIVNNENVTLMDWAKNIKENQGTSFLENIDIVIIDSYLADIEVYRKVSQKVPSPIYLDDYLRIDYPNGTILNWSICAPQLDYIKKEGLSYLLGPQYISMRQPFLNVKERPVAEKVNSVLITFGGDDSKNMTPGVLKYLTEKHPHLIKNVIIGSAYNNTTEIKTVVDANTYLIFSPDGKGMKNTMMNSDIAISSGGQTLFELARTSLPAIVIAVAENQNNNVLSWNKTGFIEYAGFWTDKDIILNVATKFEGMLDYDRRKQAVKAGRDTVPGNGAENIIKASGGSPRGRF
jgi:UDP-2,4-diacetamido-2,4,6-trideoxy-beta-L-altropyranose hydrolase